MDRIYFDIQDKDSGDTPVKELHYYKWLKENKPTDIHYGTTKLEYLNVQGFSIHNHKLREEDIHTLRYCEHTYFREVLKPKLIKK